MKIHFGWDLDGARWSESFSYGVTTVGPHGLRDILATRLGLSAAQPAEPMRIAAYRTAIATTDPSWCRASFATDAWSTAGTLLALRDELVSAGWDGSLTDGGDRLAALAEIETAFHAPGAADLLHEIATTLEGTQTWPLDIERIIIDGSFTDFPSPWPAIIDNLQRWGVAVESRPADAEAPNLEVVTCTTEWDAAEFTARVAATHPDFHILATAGTELLDYELSARGCPQVGHTTISTQHHLHLLAEVFLQAVSEPIDITALTELLDTTLPCVDPIARCKRDVSLFPRKMRWELLRALRELPGIGGPVWQEALERLSDNDTAARIAGQLNQFVTSPLCCDEAGTMSAAELTCRLKWLGELLARHPRCSDVSADSAVRRQLDTLCLVLDEFDRISSAELGRVLAQCRVYADSPFARAQAAPAPRVTNPSHIRGGCVLWWGAFDTAGRPSHPWTQAETEALANHGIDITPRSAQLELVFASRLRGLARAQRVIAVLPKTVHNQAVQPDPALVFAAYSKLLHDGVPERELASLDSSDMILSYISTPDTQFTATGVWSFDDKQVELADGAVWRPDPDQVRMAAVTRAVTPGPQLLPMRLSFSQIERLLAHPLEWLLSYQIGVRPGWRYDVSDGNRMVGTFLHAIVERIVDDAHDNPVQPSADEVERLFIELAPQYAAALEQPQFSRWRNQVLGEARYSIPRLFEVLDWMSVVPVAAEQFFSVITNFNIGDHTDPLESYTQPVTITGYRDLEARGPEGRCVTVDLKYTNSFKRYTESVSQGEDLQLALYEWAQQQDDPDVDISTGFYSLRDGSAASCEPGLAGMDAAIHPPMSHAELWERTATALEDVFDQLLNRGVITSPGSLVAYERDPSKSADALAAEARQAGSFLPNKALMYPNFPVITGVEADLS
ncbi:PD-(D/E)XK nuclease family protein [Corynebacterium sp. TAE3-ERU12]|uniref:PD-(D/E)XK nuclease family protein n=1 Tax=Corynebacterium sp. TAE3-ERU12 TaxID=2849491 RepID=UPI001C469A9E|nr:PD-(D/E)XK nuclease family protein [Corynebacterium sp. TAE3-ERU12]MBV7296139.1 PD-(D/E)XK nuclease family protein [Corynebacterium sp. TAE3-ERU12]